MKTLLAFGAATSLLLTCAVSDEASARAGYGRGGAVHARGATVRGGYARGAAVRGGYARGGAVRGGYYGRGYGWGAPGWRAAAVGATALGAAAAYGTYTDPGYYGAPATAYGAYADPGYYGAPATAYGAYADPGYYGAPRAEVVPGGYYVRGGAWGAPGWRGGAW
jgi:hypothetical protein